MKNSASELGLRLEVYSLSVYLDRSDYSLE